MNTHEEMFATAFIAPNKRIRYAALLTSKKGRKKVLAALHHIVDLDDRSTHVLRSDKDTAVDILRILGEEGAPETLMPGGDRWNFDSKPGRVRGS